MKNFLTACLLYLIIGQNLLAQTPHFRNYTVDDGLPSSHVYRAFQDSKGFMWFCTDKGIARFDGYKFEKFTTKNGLPNNDIWHCAEDSEQRIWFLSYANAFFYFDLKDNKFHVIENPYKETHDDYIWCYVQEGNNGMKVILSNHSVLKIDINQRTVGRTPLKFSDSYPLIKHKDFYMIRKDAFELWHLRAYSEGLQHNILRKKHIVPNIHLITKKFWEKLVFLTFDNDKTIYANEDSIYFYKNDKFHYQSVKKLSNFSNDKINLILNAGNKDRKLVVTDKDVFVINENIKRINAFDFIKTFNVNTVFFDSENNLWLCTKNRGVFLLSSNANESKIFESFSIKSITTLTKDIFGKIWIGNNVGEVYYLLPDNTLHKQLFNFNKQSPIKQIITSLKRIIILWYDTAYLIFTNEAV